jgi:2'-hydroxyisoflavone reductase
MRILVLGGSVFLSREVARAALAAGHEVVCACRGVHGPVPEGAEHVVLDRGEDHDPRSGPWAQLARRGFDAVVDVTSTPSWLRTALIALGAEPHWVYVSSISAYADVAGGRTAEDTPLLPASTEDLDNRSSAEAYGMNKVACEEAVRTVTGGRALVARAGLIVGPGDYSGRFTYWPVRLARGGRVLVPAPPEAPTQVVDVRDLAAWLLHCAESGVSGTYDAVAPSMPWHRMLREVATGVGVDPDGLDLVWAPQERLTELGVNPWVGPRSLPLWLPDEVETLTDREVSAAAAAGLAPRPLAETAADTLAWTREDPDAPVTGLTAEEEAEVLAALADGSAAGGPTDG